MKERAIPLEDMYRGLLNADTDPVVGIRIIRVAGDDTMGSYSAEPDPEKQITAHFHTRGNEIYCILHGSGRILTGLPATGETVTWNNPADLDEGDSFTVPEGMGIHSRIPGRCRFSSRSAHRRSIPGRTGLFPV